MNNWLLFLYKIPPQPTSGRVYVWRKLKKIGAVLLHDSVWILPENSRTLEQFQWLAAEITELGGEAQLWRSQAELAQQEPAIVEQFLSQVNKIYEQILEELNQNDDADLTALSRKYQQTHIQDYFQSELGKKVREALLNAPGGMQT